MRGYVIERMDQGGGYVAHSGSEHSYVKSLQDARLFITYDEALRHLCPENERMVSVSAIMGGDNGQW